MLSLYRALTTYGAPLIEIYLRYRMAHGKEDPQRSGERRGISSLSRPAGRLIWLHAASVGESLSMLPVIGRLVEYPGITVLLTTVTVSSARLMADRLPQGALHQFVPVDRLLWVRRFLDHWHPDIALWAESEFWPNLLVETAARRIPMILVNGRISDHSFARWQKHPLFAAQLLRCFDLAMGQTPADSERLHALGARKVVCHGNLKFAAPPLPVEVSALAKIRYRVAGRPVWLAASTHQGEELMAGRIHRRLSANFPSLLTIIVPRHPPRGEMIASELATLGLHVARRSLGEPITADTAILLADTMGELGLFMRLAPIVFMGKSLLGEGGQNPLEPARLGASVLFGPHMDNFAEIAHRMVEMGAAEIVADEEALSAAVARRLTDSALIRQYSVAARTFASAQDGVLDTVLAELTPWL